MTPLKTPCFVVIDGAVVDGTLGDYSRFIAETTRPDGVGRRYYVTTTGTRWALAKWATWAGPQVVVQEYDTEEEAWCAAEVIYVHDILHNTDILIHLDRAAAELELKELTE